MPNWRVKSSMGVSYPLFLHSIVGEEGSIEVLVDSWEGVELMDSSVNLSPLWKLLSSLGTWSVLNEVIWTFVLPFSLITSLLLLSTLVLVLCYITRKVSLYEWLWCFEILGHAFACELLVVCRVINICECRESNDFLKSSYVQVTLADEYQPCFMEKLCSCLKTE